MSRAIWLSEEFTLKHGPHLSLIAMKASESSRSAGRARAKKRFMKTPKAQTSVRLDAMHTAGKDLLPYLELTKARRPGRQVQRVNVDFPVDLLSSIDREAKRVGVSRQAFIKLRLADALTSSR